MTICLQTTFELTGGVVSSMYSQLPLNNGDVVRLPVPFVSVGDELVIAPAVSADGDTALRIDLALWTPMKLTALNDAPTLPMVAPQAMAVDAGLAFDGDPATSWSDSDDTKLDWLEAWAARTMSGPDRPYEATPRNS